MISLEKNKKIKYIYHWINPSKTQTIVNVLICCAFIFKNKLNKFFFI